MAKANRLICIHEGCAEYRVKQNRCFKHWNMWRLDPPAPVRPDYHAVHINCRKRWGRAGRHACRHCGHRAEHWAYNHLDPNEKWDGGLVYSDRTTYYMPMCLSCHFTFDAEYRRAVRDGTLEAFKASVPARAVEPVWSLESHLEMLRRYASDLCPG